MCFSDLKPQSVNSHNMYIITMVWYCLRDKTTFLSLLKYLQYIEYKHLRQNVKSDRERKYL